MTRADGPVQLVADQVTLAYPERVVLDAVTLRASAGDRIGVVGQNGAGKSTLLRVLAGELVPQSGAVRVHGTISVVDQVMTAAEDATVGTVLETTLAQVRAAAAEWEAVVANFDHETGSLATLEAALAEVERLQVWDADRRLDEALSRFGATRERDRLLAQMSVGERHRVRLACCIAERADILLLDEPTNHLDVSGIEYLTGQLAGWRGVVVIVTHDRQLLDDVMTAIFDMDPSMDGMPTLYGQSTYAGYRFARDQAMRRWRARHRAEQKRALVLEEVRDKAYEGLSDEWRPPKGSDKNRRSTRARQHVKSSDRLLDKLAAQAVAVPVPPLALSFPDLPPIPEGFAGGSLIELRAPRVAGRPGGPDRLDLPGTRIEIPPCGRLLVTGPNGSGKSTLLAALTGRLPLTRGTLQRAPGLRVGVLAQEGISAAQAAGAGGGLDGRPAVPVAPGVEQHSGFDHYARHALTLLNNGELDPQRLVAVAMLGLISDEDLERPLAELSVGQRRRFDLAVALLAAPHLLVLDEPTNHLSTTLVDELTAAMRATSAAVVVATHDRAMRADLSDWPELAL